METLAAIPLYLAIAFDALGPLIVLIYSRRQSGSWRRAIRNTMLAATVFAFLLTGIVGALSTFVGNSLWPRSVYSVESEPVFVFLIVGMYGVGFAGMGLLYGVPLIGLWRLLHRRSFDMVTRQVPLAATS